METEEVGTSARSEAEYKLNLGAFTKIPQNEFERQFRDWMNRDDVARSLQAQLRSDLISNFNKTALGKQILSQTSLSMGGRSQRLTLSPLVLSLNTLVAELLYAQNCHFTLSVFCTEVPFRNTLPDFETPQVFRFTEDELSDILLAVIGNERLSGQLKSLIGNTYADNSNVSLLLLLMKALVDQLVAQSNALQSNAPLSNAPQSNAPQSKAPQSTVSLEQQPTTVEHVQKPLDTTNTTNTPPEVRESTKKSSRQVSDSNFRHFNNYLIALSQKVHEMTKQFESLQQMQQRPIPATAAGPTATLARARVLRSVESRRFGNLNRSLERIAENLKRVSTAKRRSKHIGAIVSAIQTMAVQFTRCATKFDIVSHDLQSRRQPTSRQRTVDKQTETETERRNEEQNYTEWLEKLRCTKHGQRLMDRIEVCLRKALNRQKEHLNSETEMKLRHQKELLRIHYKQKLLDHLAKHGTGEYASQKHQINESIEGQLKKFEAKHIELLQKIREAETAAKLAPQAAVPKEIIEPMRAPQQPPTTLNRIESPNRPQSAAELQKGLPAVQQSESECRSALHERSIDSIVYDAKLRIQELEKESNLLDQSFRDYLQRQRLQKLEAHTVTKELWQHYAVECESMRDCHKPSTITAKSAAICVDDLGKRMIADEERASIPNERCSSATRVPSVAYETRAAKKESKRAKDEPLLPYDSGIECRNAIIEAKERFFEDDWRDRASTRHLQELSTSLVVELKGIPTFSRSRDVDANADDNRSVAGTIAAPSHRHRDSAMRQVDALVHTRIQSNCNRLSKSNSISSGSGSYSATSTTANTAEGNSATSGHSSASCQELPDISVQMKKCNRQLFVPVSDPIAANATHQYACLKQQGGGDGDGDDDGDDVGSSDVGASTSEASNNNNRADNDGRKNGSKANIEQISENKATETLAANARATTAATVTEKDNELPARSVGKKSAAEAAVTTPSNNTALTTTSSAASLTMQQSMAKIQELFAGRTHEGGRDSSESDNRQVQTVHSDCWRRRQRRPAAARGQAAVVDASGKTFVGHHDESAAASSVANSDDDGAAHNDDANDDDDDVVDVAVDARYKNRQQSQLRELHRIETHETFTENTKTPAAGVAAAAAAAPPATSISKIELDEEQKPSAGRSSIETAASSVAGTGASASAKTAREDHPSWRQVATNNTRTFLLDKYDESDVETMPAEVGEFKEIGEIGEIDDDTSDFELQLSTGGDRGAGPPRSDNEGDSDFWG